MAKAKGTMAEERAAAAAEAVGEDAPAGPAPEGQHPISEGVLILRGLWLPGELDALRDEWR